MPVTDLAKQSLIGVVGKENFSENFFEVPTIHLETYAEVGANAVKMKYPKFVVRPSSTREVCEIVKIAGKSGLPIIPLGGGTTFYLSGGPTPVMKNSIILDMRLMNQVIDLDVENRTVSVQSGMTIQQLNYHLRKNNLYYPHHPESFQSASVGGTLSVNGISPYSTRYGRPGDSVVSLKVVLADGRVYTIGNKTHFDNTFKLKGLFTGTEGVLGIIVEATFKVYPLPKVQRFKLYGFASVTEAVRAVANLNDAGLSPQVLLMPSRERIYNEVLLRLLSDVDVSKILENRETFVFLAYAGDEDLVEFSFEKSDAIIKAAGGSEVAEPVVADYYWNNLTELGAVVTPEMAKTYKGLKYNSSRGGIPLGALPEFIAAEKSLIAQNGRLVDDGVTAYVLFPELDIVPIAGVLLNDNGVAVSEWGKFAEGVSKLYKKLGGSVSVWAGLGTLYYPYVNFELGDSKEIAVAIKKALDPASMMNPGKQL